MESRGKSLSVTVARILRSRVFALTIGVGLALLLAPRTGRSSRAWLRQRFDNLRSRLRHREREVRHWQAYERGKAAGVIHDLRTRIARRGVNEKVDDDIVTARVRTRFGEDRLTWHLPRLNIDTVNGIVTLRGHLASERDCVAAEQMAAEVAGVTRVVNKIGCAMPETRQRQP